MDSETGKMDLETWSKAQSVPVSTTQLDQLVSEYRILREEYEKVKRISGDKYAKYVDKEKELLELMQSAGKTKYFVEGLGTIYQINKLSVTTPKTLADKKSLFDYVRSQHGETFLMDKLSINHQTLNKLYNTDFEAATESGKGEMFSIPGLEQPTSQVSLGFRKG